MPMYDRQCSNGHQKIDCLEPINQAAPNCLECGEPMKRVWLNHANAVIQDSIEGGVEIRHGICHDDGTPKRYYSKSEMARAAKAKGLYNHVEHITGPGSDKSRHTSKWV